MLLRKASVVGMRCYIDMPVGLGIFGRSQELEGKQRAEFRPFMEL